MPLTLTFTPPPNVRPRQVPIPISDTFYMDMQGKWSSEHTFTAAKSSVKVDMRGFERGNKGYKEALINLKSAVDDIMDTMKNQVGRFWG